MLVVAATVVAVPLVVVAVPVAAVAVPVLVVVVVAAVIMSNTALQYISNNLKQLFATLDIERAFTTSRYL